MPDIIQIDPKEYGLTETKAAEVAAMFRPMLDTMQEYEQEYNALQQSIQSEPTEEQCKQAKALRLKYVKCRTNTEAIHKELKAFYLAGGRFIDGWKNAQKMASQGVETKLQEIELHHERKRQAEIDALRIARQDQLLQFTNQIPSALGEMPQEVFEMMLAGAKQGHEAKLEAEAKAKAEAEAKAKAEAEERERIRLENIRLKAEAEAREKEEAKRRAIEAENLRKERQLRAIAEAEAQAKLDAERKARKAEEAKAAAKLEAERKERQRIENELKEKRESEIAAEELKLKQARDKELEELAKSEGQILKDCIHQIMAVIAKFEPRFKWKGNIHLLAEIKSFIQGLE